MWFSYEQYWFNSNLAKLCWKSWWAGKYGGGGIEVGDCHRAVVSSPILDVWKNNNNLRILFKNMKNKQTAEKWKGCPWGAGSRVGEVRDLLFFIIKFCTARPL